MEKIIRLKDISEAQGLFGPHDENISRLEKELKVKLILRGESLKLSGTNKSLSRAFEVISGLLDGIRRAKGAVSSEDIVAGPPRGAPPTEIALPPQGEGKP